MSAWPSLSCWLATLSLSAPSARRDARQRSTPQSLLVIFIGAWLLYRGLRGQSHEHAHNGRAVAIAAGLKPCPLTTFEALNARLEANCLADLDRKASGRSETIGSRLEADLAVFRPLPSVTFEACEKRAAHVSSTLDDHESLTPNPEVENGLASEPPCKEIII